MTETPALGDLIRESRLALGYSLGQLATKVGRTAATVRTWERGEALPNEESREALAAVLDLDAAEVEALALVDDSEAGEAAETIADDDDMDAPEELEFATSSASEDVADAEADPEAVDADTTDEDERGDDGTDDEAGVVVAAALVDAADSALEVPPNDDDDASAEAEDVEDEQAATATDDDGVELADGDEPAEDSDEISEMPVVAAVAVLDDDGTEAAASDAGDRDVEGEDDDTDDTLEGMAAVTPFEVDPSLVDEPTEAVVVPVVATATGVATQTRSVVTVSEPKERSSRNPFRILFDPQKRWLYWIRALFTLVVAAALLVVLVWAAGELFDALGQVLDSIEPTEIDEDGIDALHRVRTVI